MISFIYYNKYSRKIQQFKEKNKKKENILFSIFHHSLNINLLYSVKCKRKQDKKEVTVMKNRFFHFNRKQDEEQEYRPYPLNDGKQKNGGKWAKRTAAVAGAAILFGVIGGAAFQGAMYLGGKIFSAGQIAQADTAELTQVSDSEGTESELTRLVKESMPFVVSIQNMSIQEIQNFLGGVRQQKTESAGSGIIIGENDSELLIVTNYHVVEDADTLTVTFDDESSVEANIKGTDADKDLAVVAVSLADIGSDTKSEIKVATLGDSKSIEVGEEVIAIGNALGYGQSVTNGIISAKDREVNGYNGKLLQTNAAINPGNSGGALLNKEGEVIGINSAKINDTSVEGMGYAIPVSDVSDIIQNLMNQDTKTKVEESERGSLGIQAMNIDESTAEKYDMPEGVYIAGFTGTNAEQKDGLEKGYIITGINGTTVKTVDALQNELSYYKAGEEVTLTVKYPADKREYKEKEVKATLTAQNDQ